MSEVARLGPSDEAELEEVLDAEPVVNMFLRGFLAQQPMDLGYWYGLRQDGVLRGVVLLLPDRLMVPWCPDPEVAAGLGRWLARRHRPTMCVGPRQAIDVIRRDWNGGQPARRAYDQRLYTLDKAPALVASPGLRKARRSEWPLIAERAARMEYEDLGQDPSSKDADLHARVVQDRIAAGKTWVLEAEGHIVFQVNLGTRTREGVQIGGTYVPPRFRGQGWCVRGMATTAHHLLRSVPLVSLHVNERNLPAVACYERVGFEPYWPYRLLTVG